MHKLKLNLDALSVESFETDEATAVKGTVRAEQASTLNYPGISCGTCAYTCDDATCPNCFTCAASCNGTCAATCAETCGVSCWDTCWRVCGPDVQQP